MPGSDVLDLLDFEWTSYRTSRVGRAALRRWKLSDPSFDSIDDLDRVVVVARGPRRLGSDEILLGLLRKAPTDSVAARVALQVIVPGLAGVAVTYRPRWGREETASMVVAAGFERVVHYSCHRKGSPAGNLVRDVRHDLFELRLKEVAVARIVADAGRGELRTPWDPDDAGTPVEELLVVLRDAVASGAIDRRQAGLIFRRRVLDVSTETLAAAEGLQQGTIRKHRHAAERALVSSTRRVA